MIARRRQRLISLFEHNAKAYDAVASMFQTAGKTAVKSNKRISVIVFAMVIVVVLSTSALAVYAWGDIDLTLPASQGDTRTGPVSRSGSGSTDFCVGIDSISNGYTTVRAWAENWIGTNYSNPYWIINEQGWSIPYDTVPDMGTNIYLSLDNPVSTTDTPRVIGTWSPY